MKLKGEALMYLVLIINTLGLIKRHVQIIGQSKFPKAILSNPAEAEREAEAFLLPQEPVQHQVRRWVCEGRSVHYLTSLGSWVPARSKPRAFSVSALLFFGMCCAKQQRWRVEVARAIRPC